MAKSTAGIGPKGQTNDAACAAVIGSAVGYGLSHLVTGWPSPLLAGVVSFLATLLALRVFALGRWP